MKLIIDIPDMIYNILNGDSSWKGLSVDYILNAVKDGTPLEAQSNRCDSCIYSKERNGSNCYECVKGMTDNFEAQPTDKCKGCYYNDGETHAECVVCDKDAQPSENCISILNRIMEYTYGMLTAEKIGLQHLIKSMMDELSGGDSE